jgi:hypothetical protein
MPASTSSLSSLLTILLSAGCASRSLPVEVPRDSAISLLASAGQLYEPGELALASWDDPGSGEPDVPASPRQLRESEAPHHHHPGDEEAASQAVQAEQERAGGGMYRCPMHSEVVSDHPGDCPICGMTLEKQESK